MNMPPRAQQLALIGCPTCRLVYEDTGDTHATCPRCHSPLHRRKPHSLAHAWALLLTGVIFYIPANVLPVMHTSMFGNGGDSTIFDGILEFWNSGSWDIALLIFIASVAVPCAKFLALGLLLVTAHRHSGWARRERARLYRMLEFIGYWSMLDVLVVALVSALVQFRTLSNAGPRIGILFFGLMVIFTMLSAMSFDPRLTWDDESHDEPHA